MKDKTSETKNKNMKIVIGGGQSSKSSDHPDKTAKG
jgi:hypothetical protein